MPVPKVGFHTKSLALIADAFHYLADLLTFLVALAALYLSTSATSPTAVPSASSSSSRSRHLAFGWQRAPLLGAFFSGAFLAALAVSILVQAGERFADVPPVATPRALVIIGAVGVGVNAVCGLVWQGCGGKRRGRRVTEREETEDGEKDLGRAHGGHRHGVKMKGRGSELEEDLGIMAVLLHILGDAINNIGVAVAGLVIWLGRGKGRYYADPGISMGIALMILVSAVPLVKKSGTILLQSAPAGVDPEDVKHDLETIFGVASIHELHIWRLDEMKSVASAHVSVPDPSMESFMKKASIVLECLHAYGIHSVTLQPELAEAAMADEREWRDQAMSDLVRGFV
ncbi:MAG: hypothetical protein M1822_000142 [Bathelium mastoideum]|nr:MAG: hypothetical protein M1822_000142 [Bathelium mastoideum]